MKIILIILTAAFSINFAQASVTIECGANGTENCSTLLQNRDFKALMQPTDKNYPDNTPSIPFSIIADGNPVTIELQTDPCKSSDPKITGGSPHAACMYPISTSNDTNITEIPFDIAYVPCNGGLNAYPLTKTGQGSVTKRVPGKYTTAEACSIEKGQLVIKRIPARKIGGYRSGDYDAPITLTFTEREP